MIGQSLQLSSFSENEGLNNTLVKSVTSDLEGFIWLATDDGLFRFDGFHFFRLKEQLPVQYVKSVFCARNGQIYVSTDLGVVSISGSPQNPDVTIIRKGSIDLQDSLLWYPKNFYEDRQNGIWFSDNRNVYCYCNNQLKTYFPGAEAMTNNFQRSFSFAEDEQGHLFCFSEPGVVFLYERSEDRLIKLDLPEKLSNIHYVLAQGGNSFLIATRKGLFEFLPGNNGEVSGIRNLGIEKEFSCLVPAGENSWYAGTWSEGLYLLENNNGEYTATRVAEFPGNNLNGMHRSGTGLLWIASDNGLFLLKEQFFGAPFSRYVSSYIQSISNAADGSVYFSDGKSVYKVDSGKEQDPILVKRTDKTILCVQPVKDGIWYSDAEGEIWFEKNNGQVRFRHDFNESGQALFNMTADKNGNIYVCQDNNNALIFISADFQIKTYGSHEGLTSRPLKSLIDGEGKVYIGAMSDTAYLFVLDPESEKVKNISRECIFERNLDINVNDMVFDHQGTLWLGTSFGLLKYHGEVAERVEVGDMTAISVKAVALDHDGNLWFGNSLGLHRIINGELFSFDERTGLPSKIIGYRCLSIDQNNKIWAGTVNGLAVSATVNLPSLTRSPVIMSLLLNNKQPLPIKSAGNRINDKSFLNITVAVPDFPTGNLSVEMRLAGRDSVWMPVSKSGDLLLANLIPGNYSLEVRAKQLGNYSYSKPLKWDLQVKTIWYFRWWVILLQVIALLMAIWVGIWYYTSKLKRNNEKLEKAIEERIHEINLQKEKIEEQNRSIQEKNEILEQVNQELHSANEEAEEAAKAKSKFLSVMSHELRTPMNAVIGISHLLMMENPKPEQMENLKTLMFSAENLLALINNVLDFNKLDAGKVILEKTRFSLRNTVEEIKSTMMLRARTNHNKLELKFDESIPDYVLGDPLRLSQIMNNLVGNALKFTKEGTVTVDIALKSIQEDHAVIDFAVIDTGIGINSKEIDTIFEMFTQANTQTSRKFGGTGLGLSITRKLVELHNSRIFVESEPGKGSKFFFTINYETCKYVEYSKPESDNPEFVPFHSQRILLVEDNAVNRMIASSFLKNWNLEVEIAENGLIALEKAALHTFDIILMDLQMPEMDGYHAAEAIRAKGVTPWTSVPIIALTASSKADVYESIFRSGMNDFVSKPFNPVELYSKIRSYLYGTSPAV